jgi:hypothetical protein
MKSQLKSFPIVSLLALSLISFKSHSMDELTIKEAASSAQKSLSATISMEAQKYLTDLGHITLKEILTDSHDISKSGLHSQLTEAFPGILEYTKLSPVSEWRPSNFVRGFFASDNQEYILKRQNQLVALVSLCWAFTDLAKSQNDFFGRGSFTLIDPNHKIAEFFKNYVRLVTGNDDPENHSFVLEKSNFAYRRDPELHGSSHHRGRCPDSLFGIDVRFTPTESVLTLLPFDYTHIHFGKLFIGHHTESLFFLKLEPIGMGSSIAMLAHGTNFLHSQSNVESEARREKDIDEGIKTAFKDLVLEPQGFKTIRSMVLEAERLFELTDSNNKHYEPDNLDASSIHTEIGSFQELKAENQMVVHNKANNFLRLVNTLYPNGNNHLRVGNEVLIDLRKLGQ